MSLDMKWQDFRENAGKLSTIPYSLGHGALLYKMVEENISDIVQPSFTDTALDAASFLCLMVSLGYMYFKGNTPKGMFQSMKGAALGKALVITKQFAHGGLAGAIASLPELFSTCWTARNAYKQKKKHDEFDTHDIPLKKDVVNENQVLNFKENEAGLTKFEKDTGIKVRFNQFKENAYEILEEYPLAAPMAMGIGLKFMAIAGLYNDICNGRGEATTYLYIAMFTCWSIGSAMVGLSKQKPSSSSNPAPS